MKVTQMDVDEIRSMEKRGFDQLTSLRPRTIEKRLRGMKLTPEDVRFGEEHVHVDYRRGYSGSHALTVAYPLDASPSFSYVRFERRFLNNSRTAERVIEALRLREIDNISYEEEPH